MLSAFVNAFRTPDLRRKLLFVLFIIVLFRLGSSIPTPGVDYVKVQEGLDGDRTTSGIYGLINLFSGGALLKLTDLRARHHALHHREHHPAAADRGDPAPGDAEEGRPGGHGQDHPVHPLPDPWAWRSCSRPASSRWPAPATSSRAPANQGTLLVNDNMSHDAADGHRDDRRHGDDHVVR